MGERHNLVSLYPDKVKRLLGKLDKWRKNVKAPVPTTLNPDYDAAFEKKKLNELL